MAARYATVAEVLEIAPELSELDEALLGAIVTHTQYLIGLNRWGVRASIGHAWLAAHAAAYTQDVATPGGSGVPASEALGPASVSYAAVSVSSDELLATTRYGQMYVALRKIVAGRGHALVANRRIRQS